MFQGDLLWTYHVLKKEKYTKEIKEEPSFYIFQTLLKDNKNTHSSEE